MTASTVGSRAPKNELRKRNRQTRDVPDVKGLTYLGVFLEVVAEWGRTLRALVLMSVPIGAVAALAIYLGPYGIGALAALIGGEGFRRARRRRRRSE